MTSDSHWDDDELPTDEELEAAFAASDDFPETGIGSLASVGQRAIARIIDAFLAFNVGGLVAFALLSPDADDGFWAGVLFIAAIVVVAGIYEATAVAWRGQTIGKWLLGARVARFSDGQNPVLSEASVRYAVPTVMLFIPYIGQIVWIGVYLSAIPNDRKQGLHDKAAGTVVVRSR